MPDDDTVLIEFEGEAPDVDAEVTDLAAWFTEEDDLRGSVETLKAPALEGSLGGLAYAVKVLPELGKAASKSLLGWLKQRLLTHGTVKLSITREGLGSVTLEASSVAEIDELWPLVRELLS